MCAVITVLARTSLADGTPVATSETRTQPGDEPIERVPTLPADHTASEVEGAPLPGAESGRTDRVDPGDSGFRILARGVLFVPKLAVELAGTPVRGSLWAYDRFQLGERYYQLFYNDARTVGLYPVASYTGGAGVLAGAGFVVRDRSPDGASITASAAIGAGYHQRELLQVRSGDRFSDRFELGLDVGFLRRPQDRFDGIGNGDLAAPPAVPIDPRTDPTAIETFYRYQETRGELVADSRVVSDLHVIGRGALAALETSRADRGPAIDDTYDPMGLVGFSDGVRHADAELELRWDSRRRANAYEPRDLHARGSLASVSLARIDNLGARVDFWHYGAELQHYIRLGTGPRVLALRVRGDGVTGTRDEVPFMELPALGGDQFLRGYDFERFRDRVAAFGTAQYEWDVSANSAAYVFVDAGRVMPSVADATLDHLRVGYGVGLELHGLDGGFLVEGSLASSIDGGIMLNATLNPVLDARPRWR